jgi:hypothetical protein
MCNSTAPRLHFQLMDSADLMSAKGVPCAFRSCEVLRDGRWQKVENAIPGSADRIRYVSTGSRGSQSGEDAG